MNEVRRMFDESEGELLQKLHHTKENLSIENENKKNVEATLN